MKNVEKRNGKYVVTANADVFIVPNRFYYLNPDLKSDIRRAKRTCDSLNEKFYKTDLIGQFWLTSEDLNSDNIACHGFRLEQHKYVTGGEISEYFPVKIFEDLKENESKEIIMNIFAKDSDSDEDNEIPVELHLNVTAKQTKYRYRSYGNFEDTFKRSIR